MLIRLGYDLRFWLNASAAMITMLNVHPSREMDLVEPVWVNVSPEVARTEFRDSFGNHGCRFSLPQGEVRLWSSTLIRDSGEPDRQDFTAREVPVQELPSETLPYLMNSRYCEVDLLSQTAAQLFGGLPRGYQRVQAVCDWVHNNVVFGYQFASQARTAMNVYTERVGVCRDFQHLAIAFCRSLNIPARYATGYLGDIGVPPGPCPMDFSAWFEAYLGNRWWTFDARHNTPRIGRVLMAVGRDATDVAITTSFGEANLLQFQVTTEEAFESTVDQPGPSWQPSSAA